LLDRYDEALTEEMRQHCEHVAQLARLHLAANRRKRRGSHERAQAGPELDRLIAEKVMQPRGKDGELCHRHHPRPGLVPSTNIAHAFEVVEHSKSLPMLVLDLYSQAAVGLPAWKATMTKTCGAWLARPTAHAICLAALGRLPMIDDDEWQHTEPRWPAACACWPIAGMMLAAWAWRCW